MRASLAVACFFVASDVEALPSSVLLGKRLCSERPKVCVTGSVYFDKEASVLSFKGRVGQTRQRGTLSIRLGAYSSRASEVDSVWLRVPISGRSFALVEAESRTRAHGTRLKWKSLTVSFSE